MTTPDDFGWVDRDACPFRSRHLALAAGRMHSVAEGQGEPVVTVHGTPDWSFLWRHLIRGLATGYRCIGTDHFLAELSDAMACRRY